MMFEELAGFNAGVPVKGIRFYLVEEKTFLIASRRPLKVLSSAPLGDGRREARFIFNHTVAKDYNNDNPAGDLVRLAEKMNLGEQVLGLMTAVDVRHTVMSTGTRAGLAVAALGTVGVGNPCSAGMPVPAQHNTPAPGTINLVILVDGNLTPAAMVNAVITATEAKTRALFQAGVRLEDGSAATGTTTDAVVIACTGAGKPHPYAGAATDLGFLIGHTVYRSVSRGIDVYFKAVVAGGL